MLLALDTSTPLVAVALHDGRGVVHRAVSEARMQHGEQLGVMIDAALRAVGADRLDLTGVAVGVGPGPFTGLRVGVVTARVLSLALDVPTHGVSSLDVLAAAAADEQAAGGQPPEPFVATLDARRKELFWASYDATGQRVSDLQVTRPDDVPEGLVVGAGPVLYPDAFTRVAGPTAPDAGVLAQVVLDRRAEVVAAEPIYLRRPDAQVPGPPKAVS
ncbi:tRNA (adenosine(37)-N6)-threonylcarbamoyltransferase complex dimerization subunit type 1 TsaB [Nocardioides sp. HDW12B]|uniref:tRNA (adenosine(37)-N6)-threonylcarbamoyltransferase complex dimerization subunit type 1 TsaB n=1 Tax=Nocardioides sp. HDW12B TaxID=2714939 RepID=UPI0014086FFA|nr:tRNA (adenosine(37)-N6)-threonylcarbamoyltransferase complex dimerization subunit type 1 TsaB [Nocardioides sp. HDW12B]QIK65435.1 tRNA (adenosine(37)-N6)-threonylcarbamoyltransferase complex dimerization subunit type 1 TsaB [Nocardioides sp. HDW12B]